MKVPILRHGDILLTSFQDDMTDRDGLQLQGDLLEMIERTGAVGVLMDVTALDSVDSYQAKLLSDTASMAALLGCEVVLSGIQPKVAVTLVDLGDVLTGVRTALNAEKGMQLLQPNGAELPAAADAEDDRDADDGDPLAVAEAGAPGPGGVATDG